LTAFHCGRRGKHLGHLLNKNPFVVRGECGGKREALKYLATSSNSPETAFSDPSMANTSDIKNGMVLNHNNGLWQIVEFLHVKPGKGAAFVRTKLKNIETGKVVDHTFNAGHKIDPVRIEGAPISLQRRGRIPLHEHGDLRADPA
jgi:hypothetical protein